MAGLWIAYLVPHRLRYRQQLLESRTDDRFSERLRVLRVATAAGQGTQAVRQVAARSGQVQLHPFSGRARQGGGSMDRPHATRDRLSAAAARRTAAEHAQRAARLDRRAAAARRRALLTVLLLLAVAGGWTAVAVVGAGVALGAAPTVLLAAVLGLGRRAVLAGARADAAWAAGAEHRVPLPGAERAAAGSTAVARTPSVTGRAVRPSDATTEVLARIPALGGGRTATSMDAAIATAPAGVVAAAPVAGSDDSTWSPVPVPRPAYTLKPAARRAEPAPLDLEDWSTAAAAASAAVRADSDGATDDGRLEDAGTVVGTGGLNLDAILARRRAAGE